VHHEGHQGPLHGGGARRGQRVRPVDAQLAVPGGRHHRADRLRLRLRRQVRRRPGRVTVNGVCDGARVPVTRSGVNVCYEYGYARRPGRANDKTTVVIGRSRLSYTHSATKPCMGRKFFSLIRIYIHIYFLLLLLFISGFICFTSVLILKRHC